MDSILESVKKLLGISETDYDFDTDIIIHINTILNTLTQIGVGPEEGFAIEDESAEWTDFIGDSKKLNLVKSYVFLRVRILFDPPVGSTLDAMQRQVDELTWRISNVVDYKN